MKTQKFKRTLSLFLAMLMCVTTLFGMGTTAFAAEETDEVYLISYPRDGDANYGGEWGHDSLSFMNGWSTATSRFTTIRAMGSYEGNICYCIEPGVPQQTGKPRYANQRGIGSDFIGDANGNDKHYSFGIPAVAASDTLHLFESAVDLLSYGTLQKLDGKDWRSENLLSLAGVYKPRAEIEESSLPAALVRYLAEHPHIRRVVLRLDNDATGRIAAETIKTLLPGKYAVTVDIQPPPQGKDYNDCLCMRLGLPITKRGERSKER